MDLWVDYKMSDKSSEKYSSQKRVAILFGSIFLIMGIMSFLYSFTFWGSGEKDLGEEGWFEEGQDRSDKWFAFGAGGMFMMVIGGVLLQFALVRKVSKYVATETSPAAEIMGNAVGKGVTSGIKNAGGIKLKHSHNNESRPREIGSDDKLKSSSSTLR
jgi:hypothetical protein